MRIATILALLSACIDYDLVPEPMIQPAPYEHVYAPVVDDTATPEWIELPPEECNGIDDDLNGVIDDGFPDFDGDGIADCLDDACDLGHVELPEVAVDERCGDAIRDVDDPWNVRVEWQYSTRGGGSIVMPAVGNLTDDNGDGQVDDGDVPDVVFTEWDNGELIALSGDGGGEIFTIGGIYGGGGVTIADVDGDGEPEVVASNADGQVIAIDATGSIEWTSARYPLADYPQPAVADLDGDGDVEVVYDAAVVDGSTGGHIANLNRVGAKWRTPVLADLDVDGTYEIILGEDVYDHTGGLEWSGGALANGNFAAVADIDGDPGGEVFFVTGTQVFVHDDDGTELWHFPLPDNNPGPPSVADFDGDGAVEIAVPANTWLSVYEVDGTQNWAMPISDRSGLAGCSGYDVDGDGAYEVLYADQDAFYILDGTSGEVRYTYSDHGSGTLWEYPVVADIDGDGSAEIVISNNVFSGGAKSGVMVFGHDGDGWAESGPTWGTHDFAVTNLGADGSVPTSPPTSWSVHNVFRARPVVDAPGIDLQARIMDVCESGCDPAVSVVELLLHVVNAGQTRSRAGLPVSVWRLDADGTEHLIAVESTMEAVESGGAVALTLRLRRGDVGDHGLVVVVDDDGGTGWQSECHEDNNRAVWLDLRDCPPE